MNVVASTIVGILFFAHVVDAAARELLMLAIRVFCVFALLTNTGFFDTGAMIQIHVTLLAAVIIHFAAFPRRWKTTQRRRVGIHHTHGSCREDDDDRKEGQDVVRKFHR